MLDKILGQVASPLGVAVVVGLLALAALACGWRGRAAGLIAFSVAWLWAWSTPFASDALLDRVSAPYVRRHVDSLPAADAIVLLGGSFDQTVDEWIYPELNGAADRVWHAARLYHAGKAPLILVSAGSAWAAPGVQSPAANTRLVLTDLGVPDSAIILEADSRSTRENATHAAPIAAANGIEQVLLVTSAWHMRRAEAAFKRVGFDLTPAPADYARLRATTRLPSFLPSATALQRSSQVCREYLGFLVYRLRGWV